MQILATTYSAVFGVGLLLGIFHLLIWRKMPGKREFLLAAVMGVSAGFIGLCEAAFLRSPHPATFNSVFELQNTAIGIMLISMTWFVNQKLGTGRKWLAWGITVSWVFFICLSIISLLWTPLIQITELETFTTEWGETYHVPVVPEIPLLALSELTTLAIVLFVLDATVRAFRTGQRSDAIWIGGGILFFIVVAGVQTPLVDRGILHTPYMISPIFIAIAISLTVGLVNDVAQNASLTRKLALERDRWDELLNKVQLAVARIGPDGKIAYINPYFETVTGWKSEQLVGSAPGTLLYAQEQLEVQQVLDDVSNWSSRANAKRQLRTASGGSREIVWFSVALRNEFGSPDGIMSFGQDVTEQLVAQSERDNARREVEKLSRAMTMGEMASAFAHELSQPIAAVLSNAQTLQILQREDVADQQDNEKSEILDDIIRDTRRARDLMNRVRSFIFDAKPERDLFEFGALVTETLDMLHNEALRRSVTISVVPPDSNLEVLAARTEMQQVVLNIALNAIQALEDTDGGKVRVSWCRTDAQLVELCIEDNGPGLPEKVADTAMTAFVTTKDGGSGIGLAICRRVARRHGGDIQTDRSELGGAQFRVSLDILPTNSLV